MQNGHGNGMQNGHGNGMQNGHGNGVQNGHGNGVQNGHGNGVSESSESSTPALESGSSGSGSQSRTSSSSGSTSPEHVQQAPEIQIPLQSRSSSSSASTSPEHIQQVPEIQIPPHLAPFQPSGLRNLVRERYINYNDHVIANYYRHQQSLLGHPNYALVPTHLLPLHLRPIQNFFHPFLHQNVFRSPNQAASFNIALFNYFKDISALYDRGTPEELRHGNENVAPVNIGNRVVDIMQGMRISRTEYKEQMDRRLLTRQIQAQIRQNLLAQINLNIDCNSPNTSNTSNESQQNETKNLPSTSSKKSLKKTNDKPRKEENRKFEPYINKSDLDRGLQTNRLIQGVMRINPNQFQHGYVATMNKGEQDILIDGIRNRNRALEGDVVAVELLTDDTVNQKDGNKQKQGKVVFIIEKVHTRKCIGTLKLMPDKNRQRALFIPRDSRVPRLNIPFTNWPDNFYENAKSYEKTLFLVKINDWFDTRFALGKIISFLGEAGHIQTETVAILAQNDLDVTPFGPEWKKYFPSMDYVIPQEEIKLREDCRKLCLFSIDPLNCRDIDDAVSCVTLNNGNYEIGVHISDVSHYLKENTPLDKKVAEKGTTIYMVEKAYHMLPDELCMLCSLFPGTDKLAFSVFWEITENAQVISHRFAKTVISSCAQLAYEHAQDVLDEKPDSEIKFPEIYNGIKKEDIFKTIKVLGNISSILRKKRFDGGALRIDQPKVYFRLNCQNGLPESFSIEHCRESHNLIEELMLLANMTVAKRTYKDHPTLAFLRSHPAPNVYMLRELAKSLLAIGINLDISSAGSIHKSLLPYIGPDCLDKGRAMVLNMLCAKPMTRAKYFCSYGCLAEDMRHYALNVSMYTHFTSPIRRYADIMVHRLLAACLGYREVPEWEVEHVQAVAANCNKQKYNAKKAGEMSTEMYTLKYISLHSPMVTKAVVVEVKERYIDVIVVAMGLNRRLFLNNDFPGEFCFDRNEACSRLSKMELTWRAKDDWPEIKQVIGVFDIISVELTQGQEINKIDVKLTRPTDAKSK